MSARGRLPPDDDDDLQGLDLDDLDEEESDDDPDPDAEAEDLLEAGRVHRAPVERETANRAGVRAVGRLDRATGIDTARAP